MIRLKRLYAHDFKQLREIELNFPPAGRVLVQGRNEAGKSTLFESIYFALFGAPLPADTGRAALEDLIGYEKAKARVELDFTVRDRLLRITRTLVRGKPNVWAMDIVNGEKVEEVRGNRAVNDRLIAELGFDGDALLNTCFVEQKKLEKLETLGKSKRDESLSKLLNLDRLLEIEEQLHLTGQDEKMLTRLTKRVELAAAQSQLPTAEADLQRAENLLKLHDLRAQITRAAEEKRAAQALAAQLQTMTAQREALRRAATQVNALDKAQQAMQTALDRFDLRAQQTSDLAALKRERDDMTRAVEERLPNLQQRAAALRRLGRQLARLNQVEAARGAATGEFQRLQAAQQELSALLERGAALNAAIATHAARVGALEMNMRDYDVGEALGEWAELKRTATPETRADEQIHARERDKRAINARLRRTFTTVGGLLLALIVAGVFILPTLAILTRSLLLPILFGAILALAATSIAILLVRRVLALARLLARVTEEFGKLEGEAAARREIAAGSAERLHAAAARLKELDEPIPASPEAAQARRVDIAATLGNKTRVELNDAREAVNEKLNYARAQRDDVAKRIQDLQPIASSGDVARCQRVLARAERILSQWRPRLARRAAQLDLAPELQGARDAFRDVTAEIKTWQTRVQEATRLEKQIAEGEARVRKTTSELQAPYASARTLLNGSVVAWSDTLPRSAYADLEKRLRATFEAEGGENVRAQLNALENKFGASERELRIRDKTAQEAVAQAQRILQELQTQDGLSAKPTLEELDDLAARFEKVELEDRATLQARANTLHQRVGALRGTRERLERELGLQGESVDWDAAREELATEQRAQEERRHGAEIVARARKRIVQKILPATMDYMRRILPQLTRDRYHDAELDPETYKIRVWDERAGQSGAWKEKHIFSGGTKDQFSLALRLAFALATMPQERGASPGFIFLDEPLGSFDDDRAAALLYLLTEGEIARAFDQIFLISHVRVPEERFTHQIRLENGVVVESSLG